MSTDKTITDQLEQAQHASPGSRGVDVVQRRLAALCAWLSEAVAGKNALALIDQAVVSGTRFATTVVVGRLCGQGELGIYSLAFAAVLLIACVQESLIATPYAVFSNRLRDKARARYAGSVLLYQRLLSVLAIAGLIVVALALQSGWGPSELTPAMWVLAGVVPFTLLWEFGRRLALAHLQLGVALAMDAAVAAIQLGGLLLLAAAGWLSAATAFAVMGAACAVVGLLWLARSRPSFDVHFSMAGTQWRRNWSFGKWVFAAQVIGVVHGFAAYLILAIALSATAAGLFAACQSIALLSNPIILAMCNLLTPRAARAFAAGGQRQVRRTVAKAVLLVGGAMTLFAAVLCIAGEGILGLIYGTQYNSNGVVAVLGISTVAWAISAAMASGLWAVGRPAAVFKTSALGLAVTVVCTALLVAGHGALGAGVGMLIGSIVAALAQCWIFFLFHHDSNGPLRNAS